MDKATRKSIEKVCNEFDKLTKQINICRSAIEKLKKYNSNTSETKPVWYVEFSGRSYKADCGDCMTSVTGADCMRRGCKTSITTLDSLNIFSDYALANALLGLIQPRLNFFIEQRRKLTL